MVVVNEEKVLGGTFEADAAFAGAPPAFLDFAVSQWKHERWRIPLLGFSAKVLSVRQARTELTVARFEPEEWTIVTMETTGRFILENAHGNPNRMTLFIGLSPCDNRVYRGRRLSCVVPRIVYQGSAVVWGPIVVGLYLPSPSVLEGQLAERKQNGWVHELKDVELKAPLTAADLASLSRLVELTPDM
jgi:hypothetical protein